MNQYPSSSSSESLTLSSRYDEPPPSYSECIQLRPLTPPGVNPSIPTAPVFSQDLYPPSSALPPNTSYVRAPYPVQQPTANGVPSNNVGTRPPTRTPVQRTNDYMVDPPSTAVPLNTSYAPYPVQQPTAINGLPSNYVAPTFTPVQRTNDYMGQSIISPFLCCHSFVALLFSMQTQSFVEEGVQQPTANGVPSNNVGTRPLTRTPVQRTNDYMVDPPSTAVPLNTSYAPYPVQQPTAINGLPSNYVVTSAPTFTPVQRTNDYMGQSIVSLFLCCPLGILALLFSMQTRSSVEEGDLENAAKTSRAALVVNRIARFGILLIPILIFFIVKNHIES